MTARFAACYASLTQQAMAKSQDTRRTRRRRRLGRVVRWLSLSLLALAVIIVLYARYIEPTWIAQRTIVLHRPPRLSIAHITDLHYQGNRRYLENVVRRINAAEPDIVCMTGDIADDLPRLDEALDILSQVRRPMYGVRGNHDCWDQTVMARLDTCFGSTGGRWLCDQRVVAPGGNVEVIGSTGRLASLPKPLASSASVHVLLVHDPLFVDQIRRTTFDLILAGHTHGGQVRIPWGGPLLNLPQVGQYDRGLFFTPAGPLYVNPGIGTYEVPVRFACRPEITILEP